QCRGQHEGDESAHGHHVAMGEMGEAQDAEDQRDADGAQRVDRAQHRARNQHAVDEEDKLVHDPQPPRKLLATSGSAMSSGPVPVKRCCPLASTKPREAKASACRAFCSTIRMPTPSLLTRTMVSKISVT